ncbi:septum formation family protein [Hamadaea sp. NPDC051192]|uniref:septum formation family protein n=1 Tax=Hamadaea sp. NPDC051192 TaxID=3154940 RepID=UPI003412BC12
MRKSAAVMVAMALAAALAGCDTVGDGDLADDWRSMPSAAPFVPEPGCHTGTVAENASRKDYAVVDCTESHVSETIYVGQLSGAIANEKSLPLATNPALAGAYTECSGRADQLLGSSWLDFLLELRLILPTAEAWLGGARWYGCDLLQPTSYEDETYSKRDAALKAETAVRMGCYQTKVSGSTAYLTEVTCAGAHNTEYVGSFVATATQPPVSKDDWQALHDRCMGLVAKYLGVSYSQAEDRYLDVAGTASENFAAGRKGVRCFLWLRNAKMAGSAKGRKTAVPRYK